MTNLQGRKLVVLGASSGIGQALAVRAIEERADVLLCGRREERLVDIQRRAGGGALHRVDIAVQSEISGLGERVAQMGPVDAFISTVGVAPLRLMMKTTYDDWNRVLDTNVVGVNSAIRAVIPSLAPGAVVLALSSEAAVMPRWALGAYSASKAALEVALTAWRLEHPEVRFGCVGVGATVPTEFARDFDHDLLSGALEMWARHGQEREKFMDSEEVASVLLDFLAALLPHPDVGMEHIVLRSPSAVAGTSELRQQFVQRS